MRIVLSILLAAILLLSIAGCVQNLPVTTVTTGNDVPSSATGTTTKPAVFDIDLTTGWTIADVENANCAAFSDVGYYYQDSGLLTFLDTENGISVVLCHKAGCKHDDYNCEAYTPNVRMMFYSDGYIYYDKLVREDPYSVHIFRRKADGTAEEKVSVLGQDYISPTVSLGIGDYIAADGYLYFVVCTYETITLDDSSTMVMERDGILLRMDLETRKQQEILRKRDTLIRLFGAREDALLFYTQDKLPAEEIHEPDYFEKMKKLPARLQVWSESYDGCMTLFEKPNKECTWILGLQGTSFYYTDDNQYYTYDLATETHTALDWTEYYVLINENYLLDQDGDTPDSEIIDFAKFIDLRTGQYVPSAYDDADMKMMNTTDRGCVIEIIYEGEPIPNGHGAYTIPRLRQIVAYVAFDALEDGLQESDLLVISDEKFDT